MLNVSLLSIICGALFLGGCCSRFAQAGGFFVRRKWRLWTVVAAAGLIAPSAVAQTFTRAPEAIQVLEQCSSAMGARSDLQVDAEGTVVNANAAAPEAHVAIKSKGFGQLRYDFADTKDAFVHSNGRSRAIHAGEPRPMSPAISRYLRPEYVPALLCSLDLARDNMEVFYLGKEAVGSRTTYHIKFVARAAGKEDSDDVEQLISEFHVYVDVQSMTVVKTKTYAFASDNVTNHSDWEHYYLDYRDVGGVLMPFHVVDFIGGQKLREITFTRVATDVSYTDADF